MWVESLTVKLGNRYVLQDVTLRILPGVNLILGPNGAGKTTLLRTLAGIYRPSSGRVELKGAVSYVPAEFSNVDLRVIDVLLAGDGRRPRDYLAWLSAVGLGGYERRIFSRLSTGEKRLVLLAKALAEGDVVLMDEPTANLDLARKSSIIGLLAKLKKSKVFVVASHDLDLINVADSVVLLREGRAVQMEPERVDVDLLSKIYGVKVATLSLGDRRVFVPSY